MFIDVVFLPDRDAAGTVCGIDSQGSDVTARVLAQKEIEHKQAQLEALVRQRPASLEQTQAALKHAQKREAIGKLTVASPTISITCCTSSAGIPTWSKCCR
jgi:hypothetical protein